MSLQSHILELDKRHRAIDTEIQSEIARPSSDSLKINELKRAKLKLKDEIVRLQQSMVH